MPIEVRMEFMEKLNEHPFLKALCMIGMFAGLRIGEILALRWKNIDLENKIINVEYGITQVPKFDENGKVLKRITLLEILKRLVQLEKFPYQIF